MARAPGPLAGLIAALTAAALVGADPKPDAPIVFCDVTRAAGLLDPLAGIMGHGAAWGDFDGDGRVDLFVGGFCDRPDAEYKPAGGPVPPRLFRNLGSGKFERVGGSVVESPGRASGAVFADLDNDGRPELYVANNARAKAGNRAGAVQAAAQVRRAQLFRNVNGSLVDISAASGACPPALLSARNIGVFDYDGDGLLDLLIIEDRFTPAPRSTLLRNLGGLKFADVTRDAGLPDGLFGLGLAVADINGDGRPDFFVGHSNRLFLSAPGGKYREDAALNALFAWKPLDREDWPCGACFADLNRDGRLDLVLSIHGKTARNRVYLNDGVKDGVPQFRDVTEQVGLGQAVPVKCPHVEVQDFDNDGWPDIYLSAAWKDDDGTITPLIYRNLGVRDGLPRFAPPRPIRGPMVYFPAGPSADYDGDGRLDLFLVNWFADNHCRLLHNESPPRNWLDVRALGRKTNRMGVGVQVSVYPAGQLGSDAARLGYVEIGTGYGYASGQAAVAHFGLGDVAAVDIRATFPGAGVVERRGVKAGQSIVIEERAP